MKVSAKSPRILGVQWLTIGCVFLGFSAVHAQQEAFELLTRNPANSALPDRLYNSDYPAITPDGRYVVYETSQSTMVTPNTTGATQIILYDRATNQSELISADATGISGNASSTNARISADGCKVVFNSYSSNFDAGASNGAAAVYLRSRCTNPKQTTWLSKGDQTYPPAGASEGDISADGKWVAYYFGGYSGRPGRPAGLYLRNLDTGVEECLSPNPTTGQCQSAGNPSLSFDGSRVAFYSYSPLLQSDTNGVWDIYLWDNNAIPKLKLVSVAANGTQRNQGNESVSRNVAPVISADGRFVAFATTSTNLVAGDANGFQDVFVKDLTTGALSVASVTSSGVQGNADSPSGQGERPTLSGDGSWVIFGTSATNLTARKGNVVAHNNLTGKTIDFAANARFGTGARPVISGDSQGRFVAFFSSDSLDKRFASSGIFVHDRGAHCLLNWAETNLQSYFAPAATTQVSGPLTYRFYSETNAYLGTLAYETVFKYLPVASGVIQDLQPVSTLMTATGCQ